MRRAAVLPLALVLAGCSGLPVAATLPDSLLRSPEAKTAMDDNAANLASAVVTYSFGQLPMYIDDARYRLLPHDMEQAAEPGRTRRLVYRLTVPRTTLVVDNAVTSGLTEAEARAIAQRTEIAVALDGRWVRSPERYWVYYRNNGPEICRIYFPGDLGSLNMGVNSMVLRPLSAGPHRLHVVVRRLLPTRAAARLVYDYFLTVLPRGPNARERALAPEEDAPPPDRTPLTFRADAGPRTDR